MERDYPERDFRAAQDRPHLAPTGQATEDENGGDRSSSLRTEQPRANQKVSKRNLYCWRMAGLVPYFKIGRAVRFRKSEVDAALERMRMG